MSMLIDGHVHLFPEINGYGPKGRTKSAGYGKIDQGDGNPIFVLPCTNEKTNHTLEMFLNNMERYGVDRAVLILCPCYGDWSNYIAEACRQYPDKFVGSAFFDPWREDAREYYEKNIKGSLWNNVKIEFSSDGGLCGVYPNADLDGENMQWLWQNMAEDKKTVSFDLGKPGDLSYQTEQIQKIATKHPSLKLVLCHMGQPSRKVEADSGLKREWLKQIELGLLDNVWFDTSALPWHVREEGYPFPSTKRYFDEALSVIGAGKLIWGTDVPWLYSVGTYGQLVKHGELLVSDLKEEEKARILYKNALDVYWH